MTEEARIDDVRRAHEGELMDKPNVTGVGIGRKDDRDVIVVFVTRKVPESDLQTEEIVPKEVEGYETDVEEIGVVTVQNT